VVPSCSGSASRRRLKRREDKVDFPAPVVAKSAFVRERLQSQQPGVCLKVQPGFLFLLVAAVVRVSAGHAAESPSTSLLLYNANIYTVNPAQPRAEAVLSIDGKIAFVGSTKDAFSRTGGRKAHRSRRQDRVPGFHRCACAPGRDRFS
jgi:hypothetical protein